MLNWLNKQKNQSSQSQQSPQSHSHCSTSTNTTIKVQQKQQSNKKSQSTKRKNDIGATRTMRSHKIICKSCYDNGNTITIISEAEILNHYQKEQDWYNKYKKANKKKQKKLKKRYEHDVNGQQLFYEMNNDTQQPIFKSTVSKDVTGKELTYVESRKLQITTNSRSKTYFKKPTIKKEKELKERVSLPKQQPKQTKNSTISVELPPKMKELLNFDQWELVTHDPIMNCCDISLNDDIIYTNLIKYDEDNVIINHFNQINDICTETIDIKNEIHVQNDPDLSPKGDKNIAANISNVAKLLELHQEEKETEIEMILQRKDISQTLMDVNDIIGIIRDDPSNLEKILREQYKQLSLYQNQEKLKQDLYTLQATTCRNLSLKYFCDGIRLKTMLLDQTEFDRMVSKQLRNLKGVTQDILDECPKRHGLYVVHLLYCHCCCDVDCPSPFDTRSYRNCYVFLDSFRKNLNLWDTARSVITKHVIGANSSVHRTNLQCKGNTNKNDQTKRRAMYNIWLCYIHNMLRNGSDKQFCENVALLYKANAEVGNRPHSEKAVEIMEDITYDYSINRFSQHLQTPMAATDTKPAISTAKDKGTNYKKRSEVVCLKTMVYGIYVVFIIALNNICNCPNDPWTHGDGNGLSSNYDRTFYEILKVDDEYLRDRWTSESYDNQYFTLGVPKKVKKRYKLPQSHVAHSDPNHDFNLANKLALQYCPPYKSHIYLSKRITSPLSHGSNASIDVKRATGEGHLSNKSLSDTKYTAHEHTYFRSLNSKMGGIIQEYPKLAKPTTQDGKLWQTRTNIAKSAHFNIKNKFMVDVTKLKYDYSTANQSHRHIAYEAIDEIEEMKDNLNRIKEMTIKSMENEFSFADYGDLLPSMHDIRIDEQTNSIYVSYNVSAIGIDENYNQIIQNHNKEIKLNNTTVQADHNDACPHCGDLNYDIQMIFCVRCDIWYHLECDNCDECEHDECNRTIDWYVDTDFVCKDCRNRNNVNNNGNNNENNNNNNSNNNDNNDENKKLDKITVTESSVSVIIKQCKNDIVLYCDYQLKGIEAKVKFPPQLKVENRAYSFKRLTNVMEHVLNGTQTIEDLKKHGLSSIKKVFQLYKKSHNIEITEVQFIEQHYTFRVRLFNIFRFEIIDRSFEKFKIQWKKDGQTSVWSIKHEMIRMFFTQVRLYNGIKQYLTVFDYVHCRDCPEASCETWVSIVANILNHRYNLKMLRLEKHCVNKSLWKPRDMHEEKNWMMGCIKEYFDGKHLSPFVLSPNFKFVVSSTVDRLLGLTDKRDTCEEENWDRIDDESL